MDNLDEIIHLISEETILRFLRETNNPELNNVVEGFEKYFFGLILENINTIDSYSLLFISNEKELKGVILKSGRNLKDRDLQTLRFSKILEQDFSDLNQLVIFNTFQSKIIQLYETFGIICIPKHVLDFESASIVMPSHKKGIDYVLRFNILEFYRSFFERDQYGPNNDGESKIYLMYDRREDKVKIGRTKKKLEMRLKGVSESTIRANDPMINILTAWISPPEMETILQEKFKIKNIRGEWFDLRAADLEELDHKMKTFEMIDARLL
ncbi:GIY-YIG nuclease family protein [Algoriphagus confluentis]|uniref:GIY-YIG nuclease family protein n=1 Tax=Algoriphagus confluentis TaxID=1697556 RepID=A0ABQ6PRV8_9BACT|nr:hypothetical protein Aconfl_25460 [Algoriphagus confluentis]